MAEQSRPLGTWSGVGIVIANMIGAGVFLSAGFMAQDLGPGLILIAWSIGALLAIAGARAYASTTMRTTSLRKRRPHGKPPSAGTTSTQSGGSPTFDRSEQRQRIERTALDAGSSLLGGGGGGTAQTPGV